MATVGRPTKYDAALHVPLIFELALRGATDAEMAVHLGVHRATLARWKAKQPELRDTEQRAKAIADVAVEAAAFRRAVGYDFEETTRERMPVLDDNGKPTGRYRMAVTKRVAKHQPADVTALIWWLKNRQPQNWNDRREIRVEVDDVREDYSRLTDDELRLALELAEKAAVPGVN